MRKFIILYVSLLFGSLGCERSPKTNVMITQGNQGTWRYEIVGESEDINTLVGLGESSQHENTIQHLDITGDLLAFINSEDQISAWYKLEADSSGYLFSTYAPLEEHLSYTPDFVRKFRVRIENSREIEIYCEEVNCTKLNSSLAIKLIERVH